MFEIIEKQELDTIIKVVGVGGAGSNAVDHMIRENVQGVEFIAANTDAQALNKNLAPCKLELGKQSQQGQGAGSQPEVGKQAAEENREAIKKQLEGAHMVFITAGMGGGTGTGAAPVFAEVARELGILTVGVVTKPLHLEGRTRTRNAEAGVVELTKHVDSLIVVLNDKLDEVLGEDASFKDCLKAADDVLKNAVGGIAEIITGHGYINVDFADIRTVMSEKGRAMMGSAIASGQDRASIAAKQAVASPLLEGVNLSGARGIIVNVTASSDMKKREINEALATVKAFAAEDAHVIFGAVFDDSMGDQLRVTVVVTGLGQAAAAPVLTVIENPQQAKGTGTYGPGHAGGGDDGWSDLDKPTVLRRPPRGASVVAAMKNSGVDPYDIPAFLRKQAD
ncbi:cell division protein FtsZ [Betaproteobacteria bacterium]|nr:cell division protein FtsZ [Betaproteobacteria bacterium]